MKTFNISKRRNMNVLHCTEQKFKVKVKLYRIAKE